jgi:flavin-dependent dehydrogenase
VIRCDALIVGGGPAGSTAARFLRLAGWDVVVADRARFPRDKVCAGWLTPDVFPLLDLTPAEYRAAGLTLQEITAFRTSVMGRRPVETRYQRVVSFAIRRCEFDTFLLRRAGVRVLEDTFIRTLRHDGAKWIVNEAVEASVVVGAGGHFCPVARYLRGETDDPTAKGSALDVPAEPGAPTAPAPWGGEPLAGWQFLLARFARLGPLCRSPRAQNSRNEPHSSPIVAKEAEFPLGDRHTQVVGTTPELFFCSDFQGYGWCVRKGDYVNVGIGRRGHYGFATHVKNFVAFLEKRGIVTGTSSARWHGHAYFGSGIGTRPVVGPGMLLVGDAAGLAYPESGEGIRPAIESGRRAAETLIAAKGYTTDDLQPYADALGRLHPAVRENPAPVRTALAAAGRVLLRSATFTRHIVLDRWFLRAH